MVWGLSQPKRPEKDWSTQRSSNDYLSNLIFIMHISGLMFSWQFIARFGRSYFPVVQTHFSCSQFYFSIVSQVKFHHNSKKILFQLFCLKILWKFVCSAFFRYKPIFGKKWILFNTYPNLGPSTKNNRCPKFLGKAL